MTDAANKHTPGPWHVDDDDGTILSEDGSEVFASHCSGDWHYIAALPADRRLVASAPDLPAACTHALNALERVAHTVDREELDAVVEVAALTRAAIAKAKGETK